MATQLTDTCLDTLQWVTTWCTRSAASLGFPRRPRSRKLESPDSTERCVCAVSHDRCPKSDKGFAAVHCGQAALRRLLGEVMLQTPGFLRAVALTPAQPQSSQKRPLPARRPLGRVARLPQFALRTRFCLTRFTRLADPSHCVLAVHLTTT